MRPQIHNGKAAQCKYKSSKCECPKATQIEIAKHDTGRGLGLCEVMGGG